MKRFHPRQGSKDGSAERSVKQKADTSQSTTTTSEALAPPPSSTPTPPPELPLPPPPASTTDGAGASAASSASIAIDKTVSQSMATAAPSSDTAPASNAPTIVIQNVVATVNLKATLDLKDIALRTRNAEYNPKRFAAVIMRIREPKTTALIFTSGKMVVTGAKSETDSTLASKKFTRIIQKLGFQATFTDFQIQNMVASCDMGFPVRLEGLITNEGHRKFCSYEPELFPGLIYRMVEPKVVLLIFVSGKIVITGAKNREALFTACQNMYPVLLEFRKETTQCAFSV